MWVLPMRHHPSILLSSEPSSSFTSSFYHLFILRSKLFGTYFPEPCICSPWTQMLSSFTHKPVTEPLQLLSPAEELLRQDCCCCQLLALPVGLEASVVTHDDTSVTLQPLWLWGLSAPALPGGGTATERVVWSHEFVLGTAAIPVSAPEIHNHSLLISYYV
jgi:hypothetical protein